MAVQFMKSLNRGNILGILLVFSICVIWTHGQDPPKPKVFICYWESSSHLRTGDGRFSVENIDPQLCTHLIYSFASIDSRSYRMVSANPTLDHGPEDNPVGVEDLYRRVLALRSSNSALKVLLSVGGGKSTSKVFSDMVANSGNRKIFLDSAMEIIKMYEFDGIDIKWELPEDPRDKVNFSNLLKELRAALNGFEPPLMLTAALGGGVERMANVYDLKTIARHVHYMSIMAYDYKMYGEDSTQIEHHSPLSHPNESADSVNSTIQYILKEENVGPEFADKVVMGLAAYGRTYTMSDKGQHNIGSNATGPGDKYPYSNEPGIVMYFEMCINLVGKTDWEFEFEDGYNVPYAHNDSQWIGYDNEYSIMAKVDLAKGLGGIMLWSLDMDDAKGKCGGWYDSPLANAIKNQLRYISNEETRKQDALLVEEKN